MVLGLFMNMFNTRRLIDNKVNLIEVTERLNSVMARESDLQMEQSLQKTIFEERADLEEFTAFEAYNKVASENGKLISDLREQIAKDPDHKEKYEEKIKALESKNKDAELALQFAQKKVAMIRARFARTEEMENQMKMRALKREEKCWELRKQKLEEQASLFNAQKEKYGQLAEAEAKESGPRFGQG